MPSLSYAPASFTIGYGEFSLIPIRFTFIPANYSFGGGSFDIGPDLSSGLSASALKLNRIPRDAQIVDAAGLATTFMQLLYQRNCEGTEAAFAKLSEQVNFIATIVSGLQEAQQAAALANQGVATLNAGVSLSSSRTEPVDGLLSATSDGVITVSAHSRVYTTGSTEESVSVNAGSLSGFAPGSFVRVFYNDAAREGGTVAFQGTTAEVTQTGDIHVVGGVSIPSVGSPPATGTGTTPPGYVRENTEAIP